MTCFRKRDKNKCRNECHYHFLLILFLYHFSCGIDVVIVLVNQLADGDKLVPAIFQGGKNQGQRLGGV